MINRSYGGGGTWTGTQKPRVNNKYNQANYQDLAADIARHEASKAAPVVRPPSGGKGAPTTGVSGGGSSANKYSQSNPDLANALTQYHTQRRQAGGGGTGTGGTTSPAPPPPIQVGDYIGTDSNPSQTIGDNQQIYDSMFSAGRADGEAGWRHYRDMDGHVRKVWADGSGGAHYEGQKALWDQYAGGDKQAYDAMNQRLGALGREQLSVNTRAPDAQSSARWAEQSVKAKQELDELAKGPWTPEARDRAQDLRRSGLVNEGEQWKVSSPYSYQGEMGNNPLQLGWRDGELTTYDTRYDPASQGITPLEQRGGPDNAVRGMSIEDYRNRFGSNPEVRPTHGMSIEEWQGGGPSLQDQFRDEGMSYDTGSGVSYAGQPAQQQQMPQWGQPQQQQMPQWGAAPQGTMANQYGWGTGLGGPPQSSQQQQWAMQPWGGQQQQQAMPQWGGAPQQQAMPQWGQMMQQQPMGGPMAGMEAARMGGGAMQQMGGGSPWASMWGDPFAGRQMTTDPNSPAMGGLPQMDPTQQLMMQMMGGGGGLSGGFGAGGGSSGGGGMSGAGQTGGGGMDYDGLANILALFAGGGYGGGGGGGGASYNPMYGGLPRNGLYYADLMGAGG